MVEGDRAGLAAPPQRDDDAPALGELLPPGRGQIPGPSGDDDPVIGAAGLLAERTVTGDHSHVGVPGAGQPGPGILDRVRVDVDRGDRTAGSGQLAEQGGVVTGARTDLQDPVTGLDVELFQHHRNSGGLRRRAERGSLGIALSHHVLVQIAVPDRDTGQEQVPGNRPHGCLNSGGADTVPHDEPIDELSTQGLGGVGVHRSQSRSVGMRSRVDL